MLKTNKKHLIKIPRHTTLLYCEKKKILTVIGSLTRKSIKLKVRIFFFDNKKTISVSSLPLSLMSNKDMKNIKAIQGTTLAHIKMLIIESSTILYQKLKLIGVGYRISEMENFKDKLLSLKLGYSHSIHFKIAKNLNFFCIKLTKLFIIGNSLHEITQETAKIRKFKKPEPYKGKGILYESEKIRMKEGKKV